MVSSPTARLRRRVLLGIPALVATAATLATTPTAARAAKRVECLADLIQES